MNRGLKKDRFYKKHVSRKRSASGKHNLKGLLIRLFKGTNFSHSGYARFRIPVRTGDRGVWVLVAAATAAAGRGEDRRKRSVLVQAIEEREDDRQSAAA